MPVDGELIDRYLEGVCSEDEAAELILWLEVPANLEQFARRAGKRVGSGIGRGPLLQHLVERRLGK